MGLGYQDDALACFFPGPRSPQTFFNELPSDALVMAIMRALIGSWFLLGYEGQPGMPSPVGKDHSLRY